jgi:hypothetical protein
MNQETLDDTRRGLARHMTGSFLVQHEYKNTVVPNGGDNDRCLLRRDIVQSGISSLAFPTNVLPPASVSDARINFNQNTRRQDGMLFTFFWLFFPPRLLFSSS